MSDGEVRKLVSQKRWDELKNSDQVRFLIMFSFDSTLLSLFSSIRHLDYYVKLLKQDFNLITQLIRELRRGHVFDGWREGPIKFPPTYKYEFDSDRYAGENLREGEKKRAPAW